MGRCKEPFDMGGVDDALGNLIAAQIAFGKEALKLLGSGCNAAMDSLGGMKLPRGASCCDMPEPCWMPRRIGEICCSLAADDRGEICILVTNDDFRSLNYSVVAAGEHGTMVSLSDTSFTLGPKERRMVSAKFVMPPRDDQGEPDSCCLCNDYEIVIWVQGCQNHYLSWYINRAEKSRECCHEVCVVDRGYYELNWYDHFHVMRPCPGDVVKPTPPPVG